MIDILKDMNRELNRLDQRINNLVEAEKTERATLKAIAMIVRYGNHKEEQIKTLTEDYCDEGSRIEFRTFNPFSTKEDM